MKTKYTYWQKLLEVLGAAVFIAFAIYAVTSWSAIPEQIPAHYNIPGEVDRWGNKAELLILPIIGGVFYLLLTVVSLFPKIWNVPTARNPENKAAVYSTAKTLLIVLKVEMISLFFYIFYVSSRVENLPGYMMIIFVVLILFSMLYLAIKCFRMANRE